MSPEILKFFRNTNLIVRVTKTSENFKTVKKPSKNGGKQMRTPKPVNTGKTVVAGDVRS